MVDSVVDVTRADLDFVLRIEACVLVDAPDAVGVAVAIFARAANFTVATPCAALFEQYDVNADAVRPISHHGSPDEVAHLVVRDAHPAANEFH